MANLFDKTYYKLLALKEDFDTEAEIIDFFDGFLVRLIDYLGKALPNTSWQVKKVPDSAITINAPDGKTISAVATIQGTTSDFDLQADFDFSNPIAHPGWEEYKFKGLGTTTCLSLISYIVEFEKHGLTFTGDDLRFADVGVVVQHMNFIKEPYAYKYLSGKNTQVRVSKFAPDLIAEFELQLNFSESDVKPENITAVINKYLSNIYTEINSKEFLPGPQQITPTQAKLIKALDGLSWEASFDRYKINISGEGYTDELAKVISIYETSTYFPATKFIITGGDF